LRDGAASSVAAPFAFLARSACSGYGHSGARSQPSASLQAGIRAGLRSTAHETVGLLESLDFVEQMVQVSGTIPSTSAISSPAMTV